MSKRQNNLPLVNADDLLTAEIVNFRDLEPGEYFLNGWDLDRVYQIRALQKISNTKVLWQQNSKYKPEVETWDGGESKYRYVVKINLEQDVDNGDLS